MEHTDVRSRILELIDSPREEAGNRWVDYRRVDDCEAERIKAETGLDVAGFVHMIDKSAINHILNKHGTRDEAKRGGIPVTRDDIARIPEITSTPDLITPAGKTRRRSLDAIVFQTHGNGVTFVVVEVRTGKRKLAVTTMYKVAAGGEGATTAKQQASSTRPKTLPDQPPASKSTQEEPKVKEKRVVSRLEQREESVDRRLPYGCQWSAWDSNPRPLPCESSALPTELAPHWSAECGMRNLAMSSAFRNHSKHYRRAAHCQSWTSDDSTIV